ncbi:hypothetical protein ONZ43_g6186 [Nemania bipapillata]|uniref:Uncharacterized protein n=1 Tax=Nemania bipapillata TaxID=110536 RepID=A0ACC2I2Q9_9PEZI|nr:hypothetical protein ONZ43_g6186 [Nemania bipapillata]
MDDKHALGLTTRGIRYASTEVSLREQHAPISIDRDIPRGEYRNHQIRKYSSGDGNRGNGNDNNSSNSNKNWNQQQQQSSAQSPGSTGTSTAQQHFRTLTQAVLLHPQLDLVGLEPPKSLQLDPSQSRWQQEAAAAHPHLQYQQQQQQQQEQGQQQSQLGHQGLVFPYLSSSSSSSLPSWRQQQQQRQQHQKQQQQYVSSSPIHAPPPYVRSTPAHQHQPYHSSSQPPRLPPLAASLSAISLSPFDPFSSSSSSSARDGDNYSLAFTPATSSNTILAVPRLPVQGVDEIVSPISETRSSTPVFRSLDRGDEPIAHSHSPPSTSQPFSRFASPPSALHRQPTTYSSAGASLLDDKEFERSLGATERVDHPAVSPSRSTFAAISSAVAHDVEHLTDEKSDDWFRFTARESAISRSGSNPHPEAHQAMSAVAMTGDGWTPEHQHQHQHQLEHQHQHQQHQPQQYQQYQQHQQHQPQSEQFTATSSSFIPLPPIRRTSTFDLLRNKGDPSHALWVRRCSSANQQ